MKKLLIGAAAAALAGVSMMAPANADGAVHYGPGCFGPVTISGFTFNYCFSDVATPSDNANARFKGELLSAPPGKATKVEGFGCEAAFPSLSGFTTDTQLIVTPSGNVSGYCKFHP